MVSVVKVVVPIIFEDFPIKIVESEKRYDGGGKQSKPCAVISDVRSRPSIFGVPKRENGFSLCHWEALHQRNQVCI